MVVASTRTQRGRTAHRASLGLAAWLALAHPGAACETLESRNSPLETRKLVLSQKARLASGFGVRMHPLLGYLRMHTGVDWAAPSGVPVVAAGRGRVSAAGSDGAYGNRVIIDHGGPWQTLYAQLDSFSVREGDCVRAGTIIGAVGSTGLSVGPHLHFEVRRDGEPIDPMRLPLAQQGDANHGKR